MTNGKEIIYLLSMFGVSLILNASCFQCFSQHFVAKTNIDRGSIFLFATLTTITVTDKHDINCTQDSRCLYATFPLPMMLVCRGWVLKEGFVAFHHVYNFKWHSVLI